MKRVKIYMGMLAMVALSLIGCQKQEIVFDHEKPQFETKDNVILIEAIVPSGTATSAEIYIVGPFNGEDSLTYGANQLVKATNTDYKFGVYLDPSTFVDGKTLADGFYFVNAKQGIEDFATPHTISAAQCGQRYDVTISKWLAKESPEPEPIEHDGYVVYVKNETGWSSLTMYMWGDVNDLNGAWPGMQPTGTEEVEGVEYTYFDLGEANAGLTENLIFSNNGSDQLGDYNIVIDKDYYLRVSTDGVEPMEQPIPEIDHDGCAVYVLDLMAWDLHLYMYGDVNDLNGGWPGMAPTGTMEILGYTYSYFDLGEANNGLTEHLIFNNNGNPQIPSEQEPVLVLSDTTYYYRLNADQTMTAIDPRSPMDDPEE